MAGAAEAVGATAGESVRGTACARWKKFHFDGFDTSFSALTFFDDFNHLPSLPSLETSLTEFLRPLSVDRPAGAVDGPLTASEVLIARDVRRDASAGRNDFFESSSLSDGLRRPSGVFFSGDRPRMVSGIAEGSSVGLFSIADCDVLLLVFLSSLPDLADTSRLLLLCMGSGLRDSSVLLPVPRITLGASRLRKKSSMSVLLVLVMLLLRVDGVRSKLSDVVPALADRPMLAALIELPLRPRAEYLP